MVHPNQISQWRQRLLDELPDVFSDHRKKQESEEEEITSELYRQIGQLKVELEWVKKVPTASVKEKREMIEPKQQMISVARQCDLLNLSRSSYYYVSGK